MPFYFVKATDKSGKDVRYKSEFQNIDEIKTYLKNKNMIFIEAKELNFWTKDIKDFKIFKFKLKSKKLSFFSRELAFLLSSGIDLSRAFKILESQNKDISKIINSINESILKGSSLNEALKNEIVFPQFYVNMIKVGEESGRLPYILEQLANFYEEENKLEQELQSAMIYPIIVCLMMVFVISFSMTMVLPNYIAIFEANDVTLPTTTLILINLSSFFVNYLLYIFLTIVLGFILIYYFIFFKSNKGWEIIDYIKLNFPILKKIYILKFNLHFAHILMLLLESGVDILKSLYIIGEVIDNSIIIQNIDNIIIDIKKGNNLYNSVYSIKYFHPMLLQMIDIGEETGKMVETMNKSSKYFQSELDFFMKQLNKLVEPIITIILGAILTFVMLAMILPTFYMTSIL